jgi:hypothetical protein
MGIKVFFNNKKVIKKIQNIQNDKVNNTNQIILSQNFKKEIL